MRIRIIFSLFLNNYLIIKHFTFCLLKYKFIFSKIIYIYILIYFIIKFLYFIFFLCIKIFIIKSIKILRFYYGKSNLIKKNYSNM